jgi:hypothetical protein
MKKFWCLAGLLLFSGSTIASDWRVVYTTSHDDTIYCDVSSIRISGDVRRAWVKIDTSNDRFLKGRPVDHFISRVAYNCRDETRRTEAQTAYYKDGSNLTVPTATMGTAWEPVTPDSTEEALMKFVCSRLNSFKSG